MSKQSQITRGNIGFIGLLTIVLITLKLCKVIDSSWWLVLSPILITTGFIILASIVFVVIIIIAYLRRNRGVMKL